MGGWADAAATALVGECATRFRIRAARAMVELAQEAASAWAGAEAAMRWRARRRRRVRRAAAITAIAHWLDPVTFLVYVSTNVPTVTNLQTGRPVCRLSVPGRHSADWSDPGSPFCRLDSYCTWVAFHAFLGSLQLWARLGASATVYISTPYYTQK